MTLLKDTISGVMGVASQLPVRSTLSMRETHVKTIKKQENREKEGNTEILLCYNVIILT